MVAWAGVAAALEGSIVQMEDVLGEEPPELVPGPGVESKGRGGIRMISCFYFWCLLQGTYFISYPTINQLCDLEYVP